MPRRPPSTLGCAPRESLLRAIRRCDRAPRVGFRPPRDGKPRKGTVEAAYARVGDAGRPASDHASTARRPMCSGETDRLRRVKFVTRALRAGAPPVVANVGHSVHRERTSVRLPARSDWSRRARPHSPSRVICNHHRAASGMISASASAAQRFIVRATRMSSSAACAARSREPPFAFPDASCASSSSSNVRAQASSVRTVCDERARSTAAFIIGLSRRCRRRRRTRSPRSVRDLSGFAA